MKREIKFRAWNKVDKNGMIDLKKITPFALDVNLNLDGLFLPFDDNLVLMQYTGINDKNGTPIYEGDILKSLYGEGLFVVEFQIGQFLCENEMHVLNRAIWHKTEIIGNIYEHSNLLNNDRLS